MAANDSPGSALAEYDKFPYWHDLPAHVKIEVLRNTPYAELRNFMYLSKECLMLASCVEAKVFSISICKTRGTYFSRGRKHFCNNTTELAICYPQHPSLPIKKNDDPEYVLQFFNHVNGGCFVIRKSVHGNRKRSSRARVCYANESTLSAALRILFRILKSVKVVKIYLDIPSLTPDVESVLREQPVNSIKCKLFYLNTLEVALFPVLFPLVAPGCALRIYPLIERKFKRVLVDSSFFDLGLVRAAPKLDCGYYFRITNEQLSKIQGSVVSLSVPHVSSIGINLLIHEWLSDRRQIVKIFLYDILESDPEEVLEGVDPSQIVEEDELFRDSTVRDVVDPHNYPGFHVGFRKTSGSLLVLAMDSNICMLVDPFTQRNFDDDYLF